MAKWEALSVVRTHKHGIRKGRLEEGAVESGGSLGSPQSARKLREALHVEAKGVVVRGAAIAVGRTVGNGRAAACWRPVGAGGTRLPWTSARDRAARGRGLPWAKGMMPDESRDAGNPYVWFDGTGEETWLGERLRH